MLRSRRSLWLLIAAVLVFAGCGPDDDPLPPDASDDTTADAGVDTGSDVSADAPDDVSDTSADATDDTTTDVDLDVPLPDPTEITAPPPPVPRLTQEQYRNSLRDVFGDAIDLPAQLEPDIEAGLFFQVGAGISTISGRGVEQYEEGAYRIAAQVLSEELRDDYVSCTPSGTVDSDCAAEFIEEYGLRLWRRPLTTDEIDRIVLVADGAAEVLGDFYSGLEYGLATLLQSASFLFREELGEPHPDVEDVQRYTDYEMASRLSYFLWNTTPDEELLQAAANGELTTEEGLLEQATRMMDSPHVREGIRNYFFELFSFHHLEDIVKDPNIYDQFSDDFGHSAMEETLRLLEYMVFDADADFRDVMTTRTTFLNNRLATLYRVRSPSRDGFGQIELPEEAGRRGILGHASLLALESHPVSTSPTLRGLFVREVLLCQEIPSPPANVDTSIPEPSGEAPTLRDRVAEHLEVAACAGCHLLMDPIGLGLENFDGIGRFRDLDNGVTIDATGDLDGTEFEDALGLAEAIRNHPEYAGCVTRNLMRYGTGVIESRETENAQDYLTGMFERSGYSFQTLMLEFIMSPAFRWAGEVE